MVKLSDIELPVVFKNQVLFKAGNWNGHNISKEEVNKAVGNTKWSSLNRRLVISHEKESDINSWGGKVENIKSNNNGEVLGDVEVWDPMQALKVSYGNSPYAISASFGCKDYDENSKTPTGLFFRNFALVANPGVMDDDMFLSDVIKDEMSGIYTMNFSSTLASPAEQTQPLETKQEDVETHTNSAERRLEKDTIMEIKEDVNQNINMSSKSNEPTVNYDKRLDALESRFSEIEKSKSIVSEPVIETIKESEPVKKEAVASIIAAPTIVINEDKIIEGVTSKLSEKLEAMRPAPMTVNEFGSGIQSSENNLIDRLISGMKKNG